MISWLLLNPSYADFRPFDNPRPARIFFVWVRRRSARESGLGIVARNGFGSHPDELRMELDGRRAQLDDLGSQADSLVSRNDGLAGLADSLVSRADSLVSHTDGLGSRAAGLVGCTDYLVSHADGLTNRADALGSRTDGLGAIAKPIRPASNGRGGL